MFMECACCVLLLLLLFWCGAHPFWPAGPRCTLVLPSHCILFAQPPRNHFPWKSFLPYSYPPCPRFKSHAGNVVKGFASQDSESILQAACSPYELTPFGSSWESNLYSLARTSILASRKVIQRIRFRLPFRLNLRNVQRPNCSRPI